MQRHTLMGSLSQSRLCEYRVWHGGDFHVESCQRFHKVTSKSYCNHNGQRMASAQCSAHHGDLCRDDRIARGSRTPFILRVDVLALSPSLHSNLLLPDAAGPLLRSARARPSQLPRFDSHELTLPRLKSFLPVEPLRGGSEGRSDWVLTRGVRASTREGAGRYCG
jgi:hypothetical protein